MYSVGATNSTLPHESSGLSSASRRRPFSSKGQKYSTGTAQQFPKFSAEGEQSPIPQARKHAILCIVFTWVEPTFIQQNTHIASPTPSTISECDIGIDISATPSTPHDTCTHKVNHWNLLLQYTSAQGLQFKCLIYLKLLKPGSTEGYYYQHQYTSSSQIHSVKLLTDIQSKVQHWLLPMSK